MDDCFGEPERFRFAAVAAHGEFEVRHTLLRPLELYDRVDEVNAAIELDHKSIIVIIKKIALIDRLIVVGARLNLIRHLLVLLVRSVNTREYVLDR